MSAKNSIQLKLLSASLFLVLTAVNCPNAHAVLSEQQCPTVDLEHEAELPYIEQTYATCFAEAATQALDYHRLANGVKFLPATFQTLGPIYAQSLQGVPFTGSNYMSSSILMTIDYQAKEGNWKVESINYGGDSYDILTAMINKNGCVATPFDLMPSPDRRTFIDEVAKKLRHLQILLHLPTTERWDFFVKHFSSDAWIGDLVGTKITRQMIESPADDKIVSATPLEKLKIALEKMVCPSRTISYPTYEINLAQTLNYPEWISRNLAKNRRPVIMEFCSEVINDPYYRGDSTYPIFSDKKKCGRHAVLVTGQKWVPDLKICLFKVRNWWGKNYRYRESYGPDRQGNLYMPDRVLEPNVFGAMQILDKK